MTALLEFLQSRKEDRALMADLRSALVDSKRHRAWPALASFGGIGDDWKARTVQTVAGLYALRAIATNEGDFGATCRCLLSEDERKKLHDTKEIGPLSRRFQHLLAADREEIFDRVVRLALRAKSADVPINFSQLHHDLLEWNYRPEAVRVRWAKSFWAPLAEEAP